MKQSTGKVDECRAVAKAKAVSTSSLNDSNKSAELNGNSDCPHCNRDKYSVTKDGMFAAPKMDWFQSENDICE